MKLFNFLLLSFLALATVSMTSCVREYTCQCTIRYTGAPGMPDSVVNQYPIKDTKNKAKSACEGKSGIYENGSITTTETCELY